MTNHMGSISHHITPLVVYSLGGRHTHKHTHTQTQTHTHTHTHTHIQIFVDSSNSKKPGAPVCGQSAWFKNTGRYDIHIIGP